ncbi:MAG: DNA primase [Verrucomicrobiota bacterium]
MAIIGPETIQKILDATDIVELIEGYFPLKRASSNWIALCPFHNEKTPSFNINPARQIFHCFGCTTSGDAIKFLMLYENLTFPDAARKLADRANIPIQEEELDPAARARIKGRADILRLQKAATDWYHRLLFKHPVAQAAREYLKSRGLSMDTSRLWKFGYAPEHQGMFFDWAKDEGFRIAQLVDGGLAKWRDEDYPERGAYSFFRHRLMFPVNNDMGETIAFSGRVLSPDQPGGKYINSPETVIFSKSKTFFGLDKAKRPILKAKQGIICEGQLDVIAVHTAGIENVVAGLGTAFTEDHARVLKRHTDEVVLCYDSDTAGIAAARKTFRVLAPAGMMVRLAQLPPGEDPDSFLAAQGADALSTVIAEAPEFFDYQIDRNGGQLSTTDLRERLNFAKELAADIALVEDKMLQDALISRVTVRLGVSEEELRKHVRNAANAVVRAEKSKRRREAASQAREQKSSNGADSNRSENGGSGEGGPIQNRSIRLLCRILLTDPERRSELTAHAVPEFFRDIPETELLTRIWKGDFDPAQAASVNAFCNTLPEIERNEITRLLSEEQARAQETLAQECLVALRKQAIQTRMEVIKSAMGAPSISPEQVADYTKQLLDLRAQLHDV